MKKVLPMLGVAFLTAAGAFAADQTFTGTISDKMCGADHKQMKNNMSARDCTLACAKSGAGYVLVASDGKVYQLTNRDEDFKTHAGHTVQVTGELKDDTIRVSSVAMPKQ